jgi:hypothetical protein
MLSNKILIRMVIDVIYLLCKSNINIIAALASDAIQCVIFWTFGLLDFWNLFIIYLLIILWFYQLRLVVDRKNARKF